jgi:hypothetical protein
VFAHIISPHEPCTFDRNGRFVSIEETWSRPLKALHLDQLTYVNRRVEDLVDRLLSIPAREQPVVIIQADEGPYGGDPDRWDVAHPDRMPSCGSSRSPTRTTFQGPLILSSTRRSLR